MTDGPRLSNDELQAAIDKAIENVGKFTPVEPSYHAMSRHLFELLQIQRMRAEG